MFERFTRPARAVVKGAEQEAIDRGSPTIEAEHMLLALARRDATLAAAGLDHEGVLQALAAERERSLAAVGVAASDFDIPPAPAVHKPRFAASAKTALERSVRAALERGDRRIEGGHLLLGLLDAEAGTVPRALAQAGVDRGELSAAVSAAMGRPR
jgi:D-alanyl-D-alanine carboxypeptidase